VKHHVSIVVCQGADFVVTVNVDALVEVAGFGDLARDVDQLRERLVIERDVR